MRPGHGPDCPTHLAFEVVITGKQQPPRDGGGDRGDAAENRFRLQVSHTSEKRGRHNSCDGAATYPVEIQLAVGANVEQAAGGVVGTCYEGVAVGEELNGVNVGLVAGECLHGLPGADIPQLGEGVACARDKGVLVRRVEADAHDVAEVVGKLDNLSAGLDIPLHARHVARRGDDAAVVDEAAARQVAGVARQFAGDPCRPVAVLVEVVDGADVVETAAGHKVAARGVCAGHDPRGPQRDGVDLVCCVGIPDDQLAVL